MSLNYPPSLPAPILERSFHASNGELGMLPSDVDAFITACGADGVTILGWETWLVDHVWDYKLGRPVLSAGNWDPLIPLRGEHLPGVFSVASDLETTRHQLANLDLAGTVDPAWLSFVRINITLD